MSSAEPNRDEVKPFFAIHSRNWHENRYVYPVISRRSAGLSIGVNLNPDKACNFNCVYCQVDRTVPPAVRKVDLDVLRDELDHLAGLAVSGELYNDVQFGHVPQEYRRWNDIAFSGDGEPTTSPQFAAAVHVAADIRCKYNLVDVKLVLITDSAYLTRPAVKQALLEMDANNGEIWAKLDAGTEEYYRLINRANVPFQTILDNIIETARVRPVVIQSLWMNVRGEPPSEGEVDAFVGRLREVVAAGGQIKLVQVHTIARQTTESWVTPLSDGALAGVADRVREGTGLLVNVYGAS
jgi:wyosine [tRNA(Phe)-imidazoG37] synthetase (radical SAM superfamily)